MALEYVNVNMHRFAVNVRDTLAVVFPRTCTGLVFSSLCCPGECRGGTAGEGTDRILLPDRRRRQDDLES